MTPWSEHVSDMRMRLLRMGLDLGVLWAPLTHEARERTAAYFMAEIPNCQQHPVKMVNSFSNKILQSRRTQRLRVVISLCRISFRQYQLQEATKGSLNTISKALVPPGTPPKRSHSKARLCVANHPPTSIQPLFPANCFLNEVAGTPLCLWLCARLHREWGCRRQLEFRAGRS